MYLRRCYREKDGKRHAYWALVESYRTVRGPRQRIVAWLGVMDEAGRMGIKRCAGAPSSEQTGLFAQAGEPEWVEVDLAAVRVEHFMILTEQIAGAFVLFMSQEPAGLSPIDPNIVAGVQARIQDGALSGGFTGSCTVGHCIVASEGPVVGARRARRSISPPK